MHSRNLERLATFGQNWPKFEPAKYNFAKYIFAQSIPRAKNITIDTKHAIYYDHFANFRFYQKFY